MQLGRDFNLDFLGFGVLDQLAILVGIDQGSEHGEALRESGLDHPREMARGKYPAWLFRQLVFLGLGVDEVTALAFVGCLNEHLPRGGSFALQSNLGSASRRQGSRV